MHFNEKLCVPTTKEYYSYRMRPKDWLQQSGKTRIVDGSSRTGWGEPRFMERDSFVRSKDEA
jgi:hypothetical protein